MKISPYLGVGYFGENSFVITDEKTGKSAIVDPSYENGMPSLDEYSIELILLTHGHFDHISEVQSIKDKTNASVIVHKNEALLLKDPELNLSVMFGSNIAIVANKELADGEIITLGDTKIKLMHMPGHTSGSSCYIVGDHIFTGDTIMEGSIGRTDFPTGDSQKMNESITKIKSLTGNYILHCGHGSDTDLETERLFNSFFNQGNL